MKPINPFAILLTFMWLVLLIGAPAAAAPAGLFVMGDLMDSAERTSAEFLSIVDRYRDWIDGYTVVITWARVNPKSEEFYWDRIEAALRIAQDNKKTIGIKIIPGAYSPEWVYGAETKRFEFQQKDKLTGEGKKQVMPVINDPNYKKAWAAFVSKLAERYAKNEAVAFVHIAGPTGLDTSMALPDSPGEREQWTKMGVDRAVIAKEWKETVDLFAKSFPKTGLILSIDSPLGDSELPNEIALYATSKIGSRLLLKGDWLHGRGKMTDADKNPLYDIIVKRSAKTGIGFSGSGPFLGRKLENVGSLETALENAVEAGGQFMELHPMDLSRPDLYPALKKTREQFLEKAKTR